MHIPYNAVPFRKRRIFYTIDADIDDNDSLSHH